MLEVQCLCQTLQHPHEVPAGQEMRPEVQRLVGGVKQAEDALPGRGPGMSVPCHNEVLREVLWHVILVVQWSGQPTAGKGCGREHGGLVRFSSLSGDGSDGSPCLDLDLEQCKNERPVTISASVTKSRDKRYCSMYVTSKSTQS